MIHASTFLCLLATSLVFSAPTTLDAATLLKNGQEAQQLNSEFASLKVTDPCNSGDTGCISNSIAQCVNSQWDISSGSCSKSQQCFAVPSVTNSGANLICTSKSNALSIIEASGATGGLTGSDNSASATASGANASPSQSQVGNGSIGAYESTIAAPSVTNGANSNPNIVTVTVTVGAQPTTLPPTTRTLSPDEASSILASLTASQSSTSTVIVSLVASPDATAVSSSTSSSVASPDVTAVPSSTSSSVPPLLSEAASGAASTSVPPSTIILLTSTPQPSSSNIVPSSSSDVVPSVSASTLPSTIILSAASAPSSSASVPPALPATSVVSALAAAAVTSSVDASAGYGGYGY